MLTWRPVGSCVGSLSDYFLHFCSGRDPQNFWPRVFYCRVRTRGRRHSEWAVSMARLGSSISFSCQLFSIRRERPFEYHSDVHQGHDFPKSSPRCPSLSFSVCSRTSSTCTFPWISLDRILPISRSVRASKQPAIAAEPGSKPGVPIHTTIHRTGRSSSTQPSTRAGPRIPSGRP